MQPPLVFAFLVMNRFAAFPAARARMLVRVFTRITNVLMLIYRVEYRLDPVVVYFHS